MSMQQQQHERLPPPAYTQHEPESLQLPSVPTHALSNPQHGGGRLPGIKSLDLPDSAASPRSHTSRTSIELSPKSLADQSQWGVLPPLSSATFPKVPDALPRSSTELDIGSPMDTASIVSAQEDLARRRELSVLSMDDPDVRLAAEALSGLGNPDFARSPTSRSITIPRESTEPEPLLSLITSNHPWLGGTIHGSISAYNATKGYSPRFVKYGAELIERNIGSPVVNTVSSVGRRTGVEKNLRRYLGEVHRRPSDLEAGESNAARKRQRVMSPGSEAMEIDDTISSRTRGGSQSSYAESLPAYDDQRSPKYEETAVVVIDAATGKPTETSNNTAVQGSSTQDRRVNWSTQLIMTTSGLGVALSDASLKSLKLCLGLLRSATKHIDNVMQALKLVLEEYENALRNRQSYPSEKQGFTSTAMEVDGREQEEREKEAQVRAIADRLKSLSSDIWNTLQNVVQSVSRYTGGALPQNASQVVRTQLLSVPQRWQSASRSVHAEADGGEQGGEEVRGASRMLAFAREGLDMIGQITAVVDGTVQSAEGWLGRIGRKGQQQQHEGSVAESETGAGAQQTQQQGEKQVVLVDVNVSDAQEKK